MGRVETGRVIVLGESVLEKNKVNICPETKLELHGTKGAEMDVQNREWGGTKKERTETTGLPQSEIPSD